VIPNKAQFPWFQTGQVPPPPPLPKYLRGDHKELSEMLTIQKKQLELREYGVKSELLRGSHSSQ
jgi:hypothetical protein